MLMFLNKKMRNRKGYTLTELIVVVAILGVLAAVATPLITSNLSTAKENADEANRTMLQNLINYYVAEYDELPDNNADILEYIEDAVDPIPKSQQDKHFVLDKSEKKVTIEDDAPGAGDTDLLELK